MKQEQMTILRPQSGDKLINLLQMASDMASKNNTEILVEWYCNTCAIIKKSTDINKVYDRIME